MNALRRSNGSLKLITLAWRKPLTATKELPRIATGVPRILINNYSSVVERNEEQEQATEKEIPKDVDPFGIEEIVHKKDESSVLVQGFYKTFPNEAASSPTNIPSKAPVSNSVTSSPMPLEKKSVAEDPDRSSRLSLYDGWLKHRQNVEASGESEFGETVSLREAHFGKIRIDSDNPAPQVRRRRHVEQLVINDRPEMRRGRSERVAADANSAEKPIVETIEADHSVRIRASDFLKKVREEQGKEEDFSSEESRYQTEKIVINKISKPRKDANVDDQNFSGTKEEALIMDSNVVPKEYLLPNFNAITHGDMWTVLKKTIIFQNDFLLAINKPSGIPVHTKSRDCRHTVIEFLTKFADMVKCEKVFPLHRIDKETTGVLLFAKDKKVASILKEKFAKRQVDKVYLGVTKSRPPIPEGSIKIPIGEGLIPGTDKHRQVLRPDLREFGIKPTTRSCVEAITNYKVLKTMDQAAFVEISPVTGYKHQIRVHFGMGLGCPILGDHKYSHTEKLAPQRLHPHILHLIKLKQSKVRELPLHLHCNKISFTLPQEFTESPEPVYIHAKIPFFMRYTLKRLNLIR